MSKPTSTLADLIRECKHPLKVSFIFDPQEQIYTLAVGYEGVFPTIARYDKMPEDLNLAVAGYCLNLMLEIKIVKSLSKSSKITANAK